MRAPGALRSAPQRPAPTGKKRTGPTQHAHSGLRPPKKNDSARAAQPQRAAPTGKKHGTTTSDPAPTGKRTRRPTQRTTAGRTHQKKMTAPAQHNRSGPHPLEKVTAYVHRLPQRRAPTENACIACRSAVHQLKMRASPATALCTHCSGRAVLVRARFRRGAPGKPATLHPASPTDLPYTPRPTLYPDLPYTPKLKRAIPAATG